MAGEVVLRSLIMKVVEEFNRIEVVKEEIDVMEEEIDVMEEVALQGCRCY